MEALELTAVTDDMLDDLPPCDGRWISPDGITDCGSPGVARVVRGCGSCDRTRTGFLCGVHLMYLLRGTPASACCHARSFFIRYL